MSQNSRGRVQGCEKRLSTTCGIPRQRVLGMTIALTLVLKPAEKSKSASCWSFVLTGRMLKMNTSTNEDETMFADQEEKTILQVLSSSDPQNSFLVTRRGRCLYLLDWEALQRPIQPFYLKCYEKTWGEKHFITPIPAWPRCQCRQVCQTKSSSIESSTESRRASLSVWTKLC